MTFNTSDVKPWTNPGAMSLHDNVPAVLQEVVHGGTKAADLRKSKLLPSEESALRLSLASQTDESFVIESADLPTTIQNEASRNLIVSIRAAFGGIMVSLVDSAPSEIAVATFKNINAIATFDTLRATNATIYITVTSLQVDNMVPNSPFPVAVAPFDQPRVGSTEGDSSNDDVVPLLVVGLSFAPKHKSGILVSGV
jgi:hypothetical protein